MVKKANIMVKKTEFLRNGITIAPVWKLKIFSSELNIPGKDVKKMVKKIELFQDVSRVFSL